jgi:hypothetical protein
VRALPVIALISLCLTAATLTADVMPNYPTPLTPFITEPLKPEIADNKVWLTTEEVDEIKTVVQDALKMINKQQREIDHLKTITGCS